MTAATSQARTSQDTTPGKSIAASPAGTTPTPAARTTPTAPIDERLRQNTRQLRSAFGSFITGVTVVTCRTEDGVPHGATVNAFTAVSLDPPLAQVTLIRGNKISEYVQNSPFAINIMATDQLPTCLNFAGKPMPQEVTWKPDTDGVPVLAGNLATLECVPWATYDGGDHLIVIGKVVAVDTNQDAQPLGFYQGKFHELGDLHGGAPWTQCGDGLATGWGFECVDDLPIF